MDTFLFSGIAIRTAKAMVLIEIQFNELQKYVRHVIKVKENL